MTETRSRTYRSSSRRPLPQWYCTLESGVKRTNTRSGVTTTGTGESICLVARASCQRASQPRPSNRPAHEPASCARATPRQKRFVFLAGGSTDHVEAGLIVNFRACTFLGSWKHGKHTNGFGLLHAIISGPQSAAATTAAAAAGCRSYCRDRPCRKWIPHQCDRETERNKYIEKQAWKRKREWEKDRKRNKGHATTTTTTRTTATVINWESRTEGEKTSEGERVVNRMYEVYIWYIEAKSKRNIRARVSLGRPGWLVVVLRAHVLSVLSSTDISEICI